MKRSKVNPTVLRRTLEAVDPWRASGPGWANSGVTFLYEVTYSDGTIKLERQTVYEHDMGKGGAIVSEWLGVALIAYERLRRAAPLAEKR